MIIVIVLFVLGAAFGSFAAAQVWRLRAYQLVHDHQRGENVDSAELRRLKPLTESSIRHDRSRCLSCGHVLAWYDLIPIVSWLSLGGKCRYCHQPIGRYELISEVGLAITFALSYMVWPFTLTTPLAIAAFVLWLIATIVMAILFAYDLKWSLLPDTMNWTLAAIGVVYALLSGWRGGFGWSWLLNLIGALLIMSGIYYLLYLINRQWIGFGDVKLGIGLALLLGAWPQAFLALFLANLIGCLVVIPQMAARRLGRKSQVPFGPFLIAGTGVSALFGGAIISWYVTTFLMLPL